jgi:hypothetical protein
VSARRALAVLGCVLLLFGSGEIRGAQPVPRVEPGARATSALRIGMLAERIAKLHAQVGQGILAERSKRALVATIRDFDATLKAVTASAPPGEIRDAYVLLSLLWNDYREFALRAPTRENARKLRERNEEVAWIAAKGARMIQEHARAATSGSAVRAAGAAMLSQRIPKLYLWRRWEMRDEGLARELREAEENLRRTLDTLLAASDNSPEIAAELQVADNQFKFMADAARSFEGRQPAARHIEFIAKTGDHILEAMERAARLYQKENRDGG